MSKSDRTKALADKTDAPPKKAKRGFDEIDSLFADKKAKKELQQKDEERARKCKDAAKDRLRDHATKNSGGDWVDDGLGGIYNKEGYTGRVEDGVRVFKAHILSKPNAGSTPNCPFDCDCCYI